jgi:hypothetical protein
MLQWSYWQLGISGFVLHSTLNTLGMSHQHTRSTPSCAFIDQYVTNVFLQSTSFHSNQLLSEWTGVSKQFSHQDSTATVVGGLLRVELHGVALMPYTCQCAGLKTVFTSRLNCYSSRWSATSQLHGVALMPYTCQCARLCLLIASVAPTTTFTFLINHKRFVRETNLFTSGTVLY